MNNIQERSIYPSAQTNTSELKLRLPICIWFTGLSGSGKSTLAFELQQKLRAAGQHTFVLDGDVMRQGLCADLDMSLKGRKESVRRIAEVSKLMLEAGVIVITASISPILADRKNAKHLIGEDRFFEIFANASLQCCEARDVKGLYKLARDGKIKDLTGVGSPYEPPIDDALSVNTENLTVEESINEIIHYCLSRNSIRNQCIA